MTKKAISFHQIGIFSLCSFMFLAFQPLWAVADYWVNTPSQKRVISSSRLNSQSYFSIGSQLVTADHQTLYTCPAGGVIRDFALYITPQTQLAGILFTKQNALGLAIYDLLNHETMLIKNLTFYQPWKIEFADVDQDMVPEVCLGVYKNTPLHSVVTKRLFIFNFQQGLQPKWRGSKLSHPFVDFTFVSIEPHPPLLVALEFDQNNQYFLNTYQWECFGFRRIKSRFCGPLPQATGLSLGYSRASLSNQPLLMVMNQTQIVKTIHVGGN